MLFIFKGTLLTASQTGENWGPSNKSAVLSEIKEHRARRVQ
jgi:hypothetical protein